MENMIYTRYFRNPDEGQIVVVNQEKIKVSEIKNECTKAYFKSNQYHCDVCDANMNYQSKWYFQINKNLIKKQAIFIQKNHQGNVKFASPILLIKRNQNENFNH